MESLKRGDELKADARDWLALKLVGLAAEFGDARVSQAIDTCLVESPFRPDIAEIRAKLGVTAAQVDRAREENYARQAADAWAALSAYLQKYADRDHMGVWRLRRESTRNVRDGSGSFVMVPGPKGWPVVAQEAVAVPEMPRQSAWCVEHIGGLARVMETPDKYRDVLRREFLKAWPLYTENEARKLPARATNGEVSIADVLQMASPSRMEMPGGRA